MPTELTVDLETGSITQREMTEQEIAALPTVEEGSGSDDLAQPGGSSDLG